ncbi:hypothetical protein CapIbe_013656 [Capra ibex]
MNSKATTGVIDQVKILSSFISADDIHKTSRVIRLIQKEFQVFSSSVFLILILKELRSEEIMGIQQNIRQPEALTSRVYIQSDD